MNSHLHLNTAVSVLEVNKDSLHLVEKMLEMSFLSAAKLKTPLIIFYDSQMSEFNVCVMICWWQHSHSWYSLCDCYIFDFD